MFGCGQFKLNLIFAFEIIFRYSATKQQRRNYTNAQLCGSIEPHWITVHNTAASRRPKRMDEKEYDFPTVDTNKIQINHRGKKLLEAKD